MKNATPFQAHMEQGVRTQATQALSSVHMALLEFLSKNAVDGVAPESALDNPVVSVSLDFPNTTISVKPTVEFMEEAEKILGDKFKTEDVLTHVFDYLETSGKNIKRCSPKQVAVCPLSSIITPLKVDRRNRTLFISAVSGDETKSLSGGVTITISAGKKSKSNAQRLYDDMVSYLVGMNSPDALDQLIKSKVAG